MCECFFKAYSKCNHYENTPDDLSRKEEIAILKLRAEKPKEFYNIGWSCSTHKSYGISLSAEDALGSMLDHLKISKKVDQKNCIFKYETNDLIMIQKESYVAGSPAAERALEIWEKDREIIENILSLKDQIEKFRKHLSDQN